MSNTSIPGGQVLHHLSIEGSCSEMEAFFDWLDTSPCGLTIANLYNYSTAPEYKFGYPHIEFCGVISDEGDRFVSDDADVSSTYFNFSHTGYVDAVATLLFRNFPNLWITLEMFDEGNGARVLKFNPDFNSVVSINNIYSREYRDIASNFSVDSNPEN